MKLLNASNLHVGGGVQVATSIIGEISQFKQIPQDITVWASSSVDENLRQLGYDLSGFYKYKVVNGFGIKSLFSNMAKLIQQFEVVLTVFGPLYVLNYKGVQITGFAQPSIIYPGLGVDKTLSTKLKLLIQKFFFKRADHLIVELEHVREGVLKRKIGIEGKVHISKNCLSSVYFNQEKWLPISIDMVDERLKLGFVGRNYPHKNTKIFPEVLRLLEKNHGLKASIYVTFNEKEWGEADADFRKNIINVGALTVAQCPSFYEQMDGVIFPSLLECFSATPLEAMAMEKIIFASDRPFNRNVCREYAYYFDPKSPEMAAKVITEANACGAFRDPEKLLNAKNHAIGFSNPVNRAEEYLQFLSMSY